MFVKEIELDIHPAAPVAELEKQTGVNMPCRCRWMSCCFAWCGYPNPDFFFLRGGGFSFWAFLGDLLRIIFIFSRLLNKYNKANPSLLLLGFSSTSLPPPQFLRRLFLFANRFFFFFSGYPLFFEPQLVAFPK